MRGQERAKIVKERFQTKTIGSGVVLSAHQLCCKLVKHIVGFVCDTRAADDPQSITAMRIDGRIKLLRDVTNSFIPGGRNQFAALLVTNQRRANAFFMIHKRMAKATLDAEKLSV